MSVKLYGEIDMPENAGERKLDRLILYTLGEDEAIRLEDVRAINFAENDYRRLPSAPAAIKPPATHKPQRSMSPGISCIGDSNIAPSWTDHNNIIAGKPTERIRPTTAPSASNSTIFWRLGSTWAR